MGKQGEPRLAHQAKAKERIDDQALASLPGRGGGRFEAESEEEERQREVKDIASKSKRSSLAQSLSGQPRVELPDQESEVHEDNQMHLLEVSMQSSSRSRRNEESFLERVSRKDRTPRLQDDQNNTSVQSLKQPSLRQIASSVTSRSNKQRLNRQESAVEMRRSQDPNASITLSRILLETSMQQSERGANNNNQNGVN